MAFTGYDNEEEWILPREIGTLMFQSYEWGPDENGQFGFKFKNLTTHICTEEELGLNDNKKDPNHGQFFKIHDQSLINVKLYRKKFLCIDKEEIRLYGDYNSLEAQIINVYYERCNNQTIVPMNTCHSNEEITNFLKRKFIIVLQNQERFQSHKYDESRIIKEAKFRWFAIKSSDRQEVVQKVKVSKLQLQDKRPM